MRHDGKQKGVSRNLVNFANSGQMLDPAMGAGQSRAGTKLISDAGSREILHDSE